MKLNEFDQIKIELVKKLFDNKKVIFHGLLHFTTVSPISRIGSGVHEEISLSSEQIKALKNNIDKDVTAAQLYVMYLYLKKDFNKETDLKDYHTVLEIILTNDENNLHARYLLYRSLLESVEHIPLEDRKRMLDDAQFEHRKLVSNKGYKMFETFLLTLDEQEPAQQDAMSRATINTTKNEYYKDFIAKVKQIISIQRDFGENPKLFGKIESIFERHPNDDIDARKAIMKELHQLYSKPAQSANPIKRVKEIAKDVGLPVSTHSHGISDELYEAFKNINIDNSPRDTDRLGLNTLTRALTNLQSQQKRVSGK